MSETCNPQRNPNQPAVYEIRIKGHISHQLVNMFEGLAVTLDADGETLITGPVIDQAALHGLFRKLRDVGLPLISVTRIAPNEAVSPTVQTKTDTNDGS